MIRVVDEVHGRVDDLAKIVRRDTGRHTDRDALATIDQKVREASGQNLGLGEFARVIVDEVDRVLVDVGEQPQRQRVETALGVSRCGWGIVGGVPEVALRFDKAMTKRKILRHTHERVVNGRVAVRVVLIHDLTRDTTGFNPSRTSGSARDTMTDIA